MLKSSIKSVITTSSHPLRNEHKKPANLLFSTCVPAHLVFIVVRLANLKFNYHASSVAIDFFHILLRLADHSVRRFNDRFGVY